MANDNINLNLDIDTSKSIKSLRSMRQEALQMQKDMQELEKASERAVELGDKSAYEEAQKKLKGLQTAFSILKEDTKDLAKANKYLDPGNLVEGYSKYAGAAIGALGAVAGAMSIIGVENETLNAIQEKGTQILQVMLGFEQFRAAFLDSAARQEQINLIKTTGLWIKDTAVKAGSVAATVAQTIATNAAAAAQWILDAAMAANPVGLVVAGVLLLIAGFWALYEATGSVTEALLWMVNPVGMLIGLLIDEAASESESENAKRKAIKAQEDKINATQKEIDAEKKKITEMEKAHETMIARGASEKEIYEDSLKMANERINLAELESRKASEQFEKAKMEGHISVSDWQRMNDAKVASNKAAAEKKKLIDDKENEDIAKARKAKEDAEEKAKEAAKERYKKMVEDRKAYFKQLNKSQLDFDLYVLENTDYNNNLLITKENAIRQKKKDILDEDLKNERIKFDELYKSGAISKEKWEAELRKLTIKTDNEKSKLDIEYNKKKEEDQKVADQNLNDLILAGLNFRFENAKTAQEKIDAFNLLSKNNEAKAIEEFENKYKDLKGTKEYEQGLTNIRTKAQEERKNKEIEIAEETEKDHEEIQKKIDALKNPKPNVIKAIQEAADEELKIQQELLKQKKISEQEYADWLALHNAKLKDDKLNALLKEKQDTIDNAVDTATQVADFASNINKEYLDRKNQVIEEQYDKDAKMLQDNLDKGFLTQAEYDERMVKLNKDKDAKIKKQKEEAWKRDKAIAVANAILQAAIAVSQVFAYEAGELIIKSTAAAIAGGIAAANVAVVASQPMPKFAKGGYIVGGSHGQGGVNINAEGGEYIINKNSMSIPAVAQIAQTLNSGQIPSIGITSNNSNNNNSVMTSTIDSSAIEEIVNRISSIPVVLDVPNLNNTQRKIKNIESDSLY
jgi:hypothetical protein